jgi:hypothetical protein
VFRRWRRGDWRLGRRLHGNRLLRHLGNRLRRGLVFDDRSLDFRNLHGHFGGDFHGRRRFFDRLLDDGLRKLRDGLWLCFKRGGDCWLGRLHETGRRQRRGDRLDRLGRLLRLEGLLALRHRRFREDVAARQLDVALACEPLDELASDDLLDGARGALHLDTVIALEERRHFLARGPEQFRDSIDPNSGQALSPHFTRQTMHALL